MVFGSMSLAAIFKNQDLMIVTALNMDAKNVKLVMTGVKLQKQVYDRGIPGWSLPTDASVAKWTSSSIKSESGQVDYTSTLARVNVKRLHEQFINK